MFRASTLWRLYSYAIAPCYLEAEIVTVPRDTRRSSPAKAERQATVAIDDYG